jgi:hypothetical protein
MCYCNLRVTWATHDFHSFFRYHTYRELFPQPKGYYPLWALIKVVFFVMSTTCWANSYLRNSGLLESPKWCTHYTIINKNLVQTHNYVVINAYYNTKSIDATYDIVQQQNCGKKSQYWRDSLDDGKTLVF